MSNKMKKYKVPLYCEDSFSTMLLCTYNT